MIPPRRLSGENCGNGVSYRVAVCRKRLRVSRTPPRKQSRGRIERIETPHPDGHSLNSPSVAKELIARQLLSRQTELAANPGGRALIEVPAEAGVESGSAAQQKAEGT